MSYPFSLDELDALLLDRDLLQFFKKDVPSHDYHSGDAVSEDIIAANNLFGISPFRAVAPMGSVISSSCMPSALLPSCSPPGPGTSSCQRGLPRLLPCSQSRCNPHTFCMW